jgi:hypothetical protein
MSQNTVISIKSWYKETSLQLALKLWEGLVGVVFLSLLIQEFGKYVAQTVELVGYGLDDWNSVPSRGKDLSLCRLVQIGSGTHPVSCPTGTFFQE